MLGPDSSFSLSAVQFFPTDVTLNALLSVNTVQTGSSDKNDPYSDPLTYHPVGGKNKNKMSKTPVRSFKTRLIKAAPALWRLAHLAEYLQRLTQATSDIEFSYQKRKCKKAGKELRVNSTDFVHHFSQWIP